MKKYKLIGVLLHFIYKALSGLTKKEYYYGTEDFDIDEQKIVVFWHRKIFTVCNITKPVKKKASMVSASKDGEILAELLRREGNEVIRGSSRRDNIKSLKEALKYIKKEYSLGIAVDGPKGPIYEPKAGAVYMAQKTGLPISPVSSYCNRKWILKKNWDRLEIPKPFSRNVHFFGRTFYIEKNISLEEAVEIVKEKLHEAGREAYRIYTDKYLKK